MKVKVTAVSLASYTVILCAIALTANTAHSEYTRRHPRPTVPWKRITDADTLALAGNRIGAQNVATTIVVFSDYECPACLSLDTQLRAIHREHPTSVSIVFRNFPLVPHAQSWAAAVAAECAAFQGKFAAYNARIFDDHGLLRHEKWTSVAAGLQVADTIAFKRCLVSRNAVTAVDSDISAGQHLGVYATPTIVVGSDVYVGNPLDLPDIVDRHLKLAERSLNATRAGKAI